ncbi:TolC family protein [Flavobacterium undicola]|uniref:TolC family protein n=1 Tax=Flavobacterium undicola TaxID=1932779 RepID=UPI001377C260|nr:TolC family protein [Flavobacterium undicola]MBA0882917.1 TolC family protein [Flavobacterium undicola]
MKKLIVIVFWMSGLLMSAQEKAWTVDECMRYAVENSTLRIKQEAQNEIYKQNQLEAVGGLLPSLNASTDGTMYYGRVLDKNTYKYVNTNTLYNDYGINSSVALFDGFAQFSRVKMEKLNRLKGLQQLQENKDRVAYETMEIFFNVQYYQGTVKLAAQQLDESTANLKRVKRMEELGMKSIPDVAELQAKEAEDRYLLTKQKNLLVQEHIRLKAKMNFPVNRDLKTADSDTLLHIDTLEENAFEIYQKALTYLPKVLASNKTVESTKMEINVAKGLFLPKLSLYGGINTYFTKLMDGKTYTPFKEQLNTNQNYYVGLSLNTPIFNGFSRSTNLKRSKQQLIIVQNEREEILREVYSDIEKTVADVNGLSDEYAHAGKRTESMKIAHQVNQRKYTEGLISALELNTSSNRLLQVQIEELYTNLKYQLKMKLLNYYKGASMFN